MIIKSHIRGGFKCAADYLKEQGENEKIRLVEMSDPHVSNLDEAFRAMWAVSAGTKAKKPLHHVSINPIKEERLTDEQVRRICERLEEKYGYTHDQHQRVIVEHVKEGRQHFHIMWNRVNMVTGKPHYPYMHKTQSKIAAREMEAELKLKKPISKYAKKASKKNIYGRYAALYADIDYMPQVLIRRKKKGGKGDGGILGSGGGMSSGISVFASHPRSAERTHTQPQRPLVVARSRKAYWSGSNRRFKNVPVPVERREDWITMKL